MATVTVVDPRAEQYLGSLAGAVGDVVAGNLVGVYVHGSLALGGFDPRRSDVDVLVVVENELPLAQRTALAGALSEAALPCPARGLELSVVTKESALHPCWPAPRFELHVTTAPEDSKVVDGHGRPGDPDLVLHYAVCRAAGLLVGDGSPPQEVFSRVPRRIVLERLVDELAWAVAHASSEYTVLNACRAWRYARKDDLVSKVDGGRWALEQSLRPSYTSLVSAALDLQTASSGPALRVDEVEEFTRYVDGQLRLAIRET